MYCIIALPRTASTFAWSLIDNSLATTSNYQKNLESEPFNSKTTQTVLDQQKLFDDIISLEPLPVIKLLTNYNYHLVTKFTKTNYKLVFIKPKDVKQQALSSLVSTKTNKWFGDRNERTILRGQMIFSPYEIHKKIMEYKKHMLLEVFCQYSFFNDFIIKSPENFLYSLNLPATEIHYKHIPPLVSDIDMLNDPQDFNATWNKTWLNIFGIPYE